VRVWDTSSGREVAALNGHAGVPTALRWAPRRVSPSTALKCCLQCLCVWYLALVLPDSKHVP
jgi:hypothetical protein